MRVSPRAATRAAVAALTAAFLARGTFLALAIPFADPLDEAFHFAYAEFAGETGRAPRASEPSVPARDDRALGLMPRATTFGLRPVTFSEFLALTPSDREVLRREAFAPGTADDGRFLTVNYEAQQPPLFYFASAPLLPPESVPLDRRLLRMRLWAVACASLSVPLAYGLFRRFFDPPFAIALTAAYAVFPGLAAFTGRFANDCLAVPLVLVVLVLCADLALGKNGALRLAALAAALAAGCWTKLYVLPLCALPPIAARGRSRIWAGMSSAAAFLAIIPWFVRQRADTGDWFGVTATKTARAAGASVWDRVASVPGVLTPGAGLDFARTFCWPGTHSGLGASRWLLPAFAAGICAVWAGLPAGRATRHAIRMLLVAPLLMWGAQLFHTSSYFAAARALGRPSMRVGIEGWYSLILLPVVLAAGAALGTRAGNRGLLLAGTLVLLGLGVWLEIFHLGATYAGQAGHPFATLAAVGLGGSPAALAVMYGIFLAGLAFAAWLARGAA